MKIDLVKHGAPECPFIRIFGRDEDGIVALRDAIRDLHRGLLEQVSIHELPCYQPIDLMSLCALVTEVDVGVTKRDMTQEYRWALTEESWRIVEGLVEGVLPVKTYDVFQWLAGGEARYGLELSKVGLLLSVSETGNW